MIPKRAIFYWEGGEPSWLRKQSWETFKRLNPEWEVEIIGPTPESLELIPGESRLARVQRSDLCRYAALAHGGGVYFDSDIVFFKPFPERAMTADLALPIHDNGHIAHLAMLGACEGSSFFKTLYGLAVERIARPGLLGYQSIGVNLVNGLDLRGLAAAHGVENLVVLNFRMILIVGWAEAERCFSPPPDYHKWHAEAIGVHWFGGDHSAIEAEPTATAESLRGTLLGKALADAGVLCPA